MNTQSGVFAFGATEHLFLTFDLTAGADVQEALQILAQAGNPATTDMVNVVVGVRPSLWAEVADAADVPSDVHDYTETKGEGVTAMPAEQHDFWIWISAAGMDACWDWAKQTIIAFGSNAELTSEHRGWGYFIPVAAILLVTAFVAGLIVAGLCIAALFFPPAAPFILLGAGILTGIVLLTAGAAIGIGFLLFWLVAVPVGLIGGFFPGLAVALFITALAFIPYIGWRFLSWPLGLSLGAVATSLLAKLVTLALAIPLFLLNLIPGGILGSLVGASLWPLTVPLSILAGRILGSLVGFFNPVNMLAGVIPAIIGGLIGQIVGRNAGSTLGAVLGGLTGYGLTELVNALLGALIGSYAGINVGGTLGVLLGGLLGGKLGLIDQKQDKPKHAKPENGAKAEGSVTIKAGPQGEYAPAPKHRADDDLALEDIINDKTVAPQQSCEMSQDEINKSLQNVPDNKKGAQSEEDLDAMQIHGVSQPQLVIIG